VHAVRETAKPHIVDSRAVAFAERRGDAIEMQHDRVERVVVERYGGAVSGMG